MLCPKHTVYNNIKYGLLPNSHSRAGGNPGVFELDSHPHFHGGRLCAGVRIIL
jgi:hypothetical protein